MTDISRTLGKHKKRDVSVMAIMLDASEMGAADTYEVAVLPKNILITASTLTVLESMDGTNPTVAVGFQGGTGSELISATTVSSAADTTAAGNGDISRQTGDVVTVTKVAASTTGLAVFTIEYIEYNQCTGELTNFVPAA
jgi:hypothetical protein